MSETATTTTVTAPSVISFKNEMDKYLRNKDIMYN